jgi:hypothetical protein
MSGLVLFGILGYMACIRIYDWWNKCWSLQRQWVIL